MPSTNVLKPMQECEGDCDSTLDCDVSKGLVCHQRYFAADLVPGCTGYAYSELDVCINRDIDGWVKRLDDNSLKPYRACEGDCDSHSDVSAFPVFSF